MRILITLLTSLSLAVSASAQGVYAGLNYGDNEKTVIAKLKKSKLTNSDVPDTLFGRVGLNGTFKIIPKLKTLSFSLFFDWNEERDKKLKTVILQSNKLPASAFNGKLKNAHQYAINLLSSTYGRPSNAGKYPSQGQIGGNGAIHYSHEWKTDKGYVYLGVGEQEGKYVLAISFNKNSLIAR